MPPLDSMKFIAGWSTFMAVVMWALCVAFVGLLDLHEFQLACREVSRVNSIGGQQLI